MSTTIEAIVRGGQIVPLEQVYLPEGSKAIVTIIDVGELDFWQGASESSLDQIWSNEEDDLYAELLTK